MELVGLWRYPVKSMGGEALDSTEMGWSGLAGDRRWGVRVEATGRILSAKREARLMLASARTAHPLDVSLPTGETLSGVGPVTDRALSSWLERPVRLVEADKVTTPTFESQIDEADDGSDTVTWQGHPWAFVDSSPVHLLTTASLRAMGRERPDLDWRVARFRPNLLIEASGESRVEDAWVGRRCVIGEAEVEIMKPCERCVMVTRPQPDGVERQLGVLTHLTRTAKGHLGVLGRVTRPGTVTLGAPVEVG